MEYPTREQIDALTKCHYRDDCTGCFTKDWCIENGYYMGDGSLAMREIFDAYQVEFDKARDLIRRMKNTLTEWDKWDNSGLICEAEAMTKEV